MKAKLLTLFALLGLSVSPLLIGCGGSESPEYVEPTEEEEEDEGQINPEGDDEE